MFYVLTKLMKNKNNVVLYTEPYRALAVVQIGPYCA